MNGIHIEWSPINQAWFVMWGRVEVLRIFNERWEADEYVKDLER